MIYWSATWLSLASSKKVLSKKDLRRETAAHFGIRRGWHVFFSIPVAVSLHSVVLENVWT